LVFIDGHIGFLHHLSRICNPGPHPSKADL
jgi:hypothetical protein